MTKTNKKLPLREKIAYGFGGFVDQIMSGTFTQMAYPIFNIALGLEARLLGFALSVPRLIDAVSDPVMGHVSDNTRSRWGRRKPYIAVGSVLMALMLLLLFSPPTILNDTGLFFYVLIMGALMYIAYTIFSIPYNALGYELTDDYDERTSVQAWRMVMISVKAVAAPWILKACFVIGNLFPESERPAEGVGVTYVMLGLGILVIFGTIPILKICRERFDQIKKAKDSFFNSLRCTLTNKVFRVHLITIFMVIIGNFIIGPLEVYINYYYVFGGDKDSAATLVGFAGSFRAICAFLAIPVITWLSRRIGKKACYSGGIIICGLAYPLSWFLYNPNMPYLQLILPILIAPAITSCWVLNPSITADICDHDELKTGHRREGMYAAVWGFAFKAGFSAILVLTGFMIAWTGFVEDAATQSADTVFRMRLVLAFVPFIFLMGGGLFFAWFFPLDRARVDDIQAELRERREVEDGEQ